jgi:hypothetical protein
METEEQARALITAEVLAEPSYQGLTATDPDVISAVDIRMDAWRRRSATPGQDQGAYQWLDQLPPEYQPPGRMLAEGSSRLIEGGGPRTYTGRGLVDSRGGFVRNPDGSVKTLYGANDVQSVWRGIGYPERKQIAEYMKAFGVYGGSSPSLNLDQLQDFNAFARVLYTANNEGVSWDRALDTLAKRYQEMPKPTGRTYKPTSIADIRKAMQAQATSILGRGLTPQEAKPLAQRIQQQETRQQTMASGEQPTSTSTLIEQGVQKDFAPEAQAFNFARFAQSALGYAGSSAGAQPDVELETMGGM